jgi:PAS domain S-box-containing protein
LRDSIKALNEELEKVRRQIEHAHQEWMAALDVVEDPIFVHDKDFHILRCNLAYQRRAGIPFKQIIGQPYYEIFPKTHAPLHHCQQAVEKAAEEEVQIGDVTYRSRAVSVKDEQGAYLYSVHTLENITQRRQAEKGLKLFRALIDNSSDAIEVLDPATLRLLDINETECRELGYSREELLSMSIADIDPTFNADINKVIEAQILQSGSARFESAHRRKDGSTFPVEVSSKLVELDKLYALNIVRDITERKRAEQIIQDEKAFSDTLVQSLPDIFFLLDRQGGLLQWNKKLSVLFGLSQEEMLGVNVFSFIHEEDRPHVALTLQQAFETGSASVEARMVLTYGVRDYLLTGNRVETKTGVVNVIGIGIDITERKRAEIKLNESEERLRAIFEGALDGIALVNIETRQFSSANSALCQMLGYSTEEFTRLTVSDIHPKQDWPYVFEQFDKQVSGEIQLAANMPVKRKDGSVLYADINTAPVNLGDKNYLVGIFRDITERKQVEEALGRANRALRTLSAGNLALVRATNEDELLRSVTSIIVKQGGYSMAAVYYAEDDAEKSITPMAWSGVEDSYCSELHLSWADTKQGQLPITMTIRSGKTQVCHDIASDADFESWRDAALARGYASNIALPLSSGGRTFGGLSIYSSDVGAFDEEEVRLLEELVNDLAYGIITLRTRREHEQHTITLRQSLEQSIETIADTVEARDPYTAGHQRRVSELATAIAREMNLPEEQVNGIHLAAIIHDLGKIHVPAEILSKPGKLTDIELMLVKTHPQAGYDILKNVKFPWPIADIILQHHEKLDGSGYPQGLRGGQILLESRIMTVADVVEAISSHRPYRSALGVAAALSEIERGRGSVYDPAIVDVCLMLFAKKGFTFSSKLLE